MESMLSSVPRILTDTQVDHLCWLYTHDGLNARQIGQRMGCSPSTVYKMLANRGVKRRQYNDYEDLSRPASRSLTEEQVRQATEWYEVYGMTGTELGEMFLCAPTTVRRYLREAGCNMRPRGGSKRRLTLEQLDEVRNMYLNEKLSTGEMAERLGMTPSGIIGRLDRLDVKRRGLSEAMTIAYRRGRKARPERAHFARRTQTAGEPATVRAGYSGARLPSRADDPVPVSC